MLIRPLLERCFDRIGYRGPEASLPYLSVASHRIITSEHSSVIGTTGDLILADLSMYYLGRRANPMVALSGLGPGFERNRSTLRGVARIAGQPAVATPIDPAQGAATLTPFVILGTT